jgi:D-tyrosyl-tRNA(Tyr) deacylase
MVRVVAQRVRSGSVALGDQVIASIGVGLVVLVAIRRGDDERAVERVADKLAVLRIFEDEMGKMNRSAAEVGGAMLVISQFTLYADVRKGRRPSFIDAADSDEGERLYRHFGERLAAYGYRVEYGRFGAEMLVTIENAGPVTIILDSDAL